MLIGLLLLPMLAHGLDAAAHLSPLQCEDGHCEDETSLHADSATTADHCLLTHHHHADYHRAFASLELPAPSVHSRMTALWQHVGYTDHIPSPLPEPPSQV